MIDDWLFSEWGKSLYSLEKHGPDLEELVFLRQGNAENVGKAPARRGSKPPISLPIVDLVIEVENLLGAWCGRAAASLVGVIDPPPASRSISIRAGWLRSHLSELEQLSWAGQCAHEVITIARQVADVVDPPAAESDPDPIETGSCREIASWASLLGCPVSGRTVSRWAADGRIDSQLLPDGRVIVRLADVLDLLRKRSRFADCLTHPVS